MRSTSDHVAQRGEPSALLGGFHVLHCCSYRERRNCRHVNANIHGAATTVVGTGNSTHTRAMPDNSVVGRCTYRVGNTDLVVQGLSP